MIRREERERKRKRQVKRERDSTREDRFLEFSSGSYSNGEYTERMREIDKEVVRGRRSSWKYCS